MSPSPLWTLYGIYQLYRLYEHWRSGYTPSMGQSTTGRRPILRRGRRAAVTASPRAGSRALFEHLRETVGEETLRNALETLKVYLSSARHVDSDELTKLQKANRIRLDTLRALILKDTISSDQVRAYVNRSRPVVNKMAREGRLLAIPDGRTLRFPTWQFDLESETGLLPHLEEVLGVMDASPFRKATWFLTENPRLKHQKPLDLLRVGEVRCVLEEAKGLVGS